MITLALVVLPTAAHAEAAERVLEPLGCWLEPTAMATRFTVVRSFAHDLSAAEREVRGALKARGLYRVPREIEPTAAIADILRARRERLMAMIRGRR